MAVKTELELGLEVGLGGTLAVALVVVEDESVDAVDALCPQWAGTLAAVGEALLAHVGGGNSVGSGGADSETLRVLVSVVVEVLVRRGKDALLAQELALEGASARGAREMAGLAHHGGVVEQVGHTRDLLAVGEALFVVQVVAWQTLGARLWRVNAVGAEHRCIAGLALQVGVRHEGVRTAVEARFAWGIVDKAGYTRRAAAGQVLTRQTGRLTGRADLVGAERHARLSVLALLHTALGGGRQHDHKLLANLAVVQAVAQRAPGKALRADVVQRVVEVPVDAPETAHAVLQSEARRALRALRRQVSVALLALRLAVLALVHGLSRVLEAVRAAARHARVVLQHHAVVHAVQALVRPVPEALVARLVAHAQLFVLLLFLWGIRRVEVK